MEQLLALAAATLVMVLIPGPNASLIVATSLRKGRGQGLATVAGTTAGIAVQLALVVAGYSALIAAVAGALYWIKWAGVAFLVYFGLRAWAAGNRRAPGPVSAAPAGVAYRRGALIATVNPKTLLFKASFLPQFVSDAAAASWQLPLFAVVYLAVVAVGDCGWVLLAGMARGWLQRTARWQTRLQAAFLFAAAGALALARADR